MKYKNPIIPGFFPDPSVCRVNDTYYLVCSSFHYFPGVPLFKSTDLINWAFIGNVLTRESQLPLKKAGSSSGIFAPTIRYNDGRFYMVTTNVTEGGNFYVYTDDINGEWSDPIFVEQDGIDPSLYFENGKAFFMSNGRDDKGVSGITQCEINMETGRKLTSSQSIWQGAGGRFLESPHLYKINDEYYLMASEGGTEYGHMVVYAKGKTPYGPFEAYQNNPVLTNRNMGGYEIQGCGHADLIDDTNGNWWMIHLGFRQLGQWAMHHITGREVYLVPVVFYENGWFTAGDNGVTREFFETDYISNEVVQKSVPDFTFENTKVGIEWCFMRNPIMENYKFADNKFFLKGTNLTLSDYEGSPTFVAIRQCEMNLSISCDVALEDCEAGLSMYMGSDQHYDLALRKTEDGFEFLKRLCIGDIIFEDKITKIPSNDEKLSVKLMIEATNFNYYFKVVYGETEYDLGSAQTKYLSSEIAGNFTGVIIGLYAQGNECKQPAEFSSFLCKNNERL